jgi:hypothetical protein
MELASMLAAEPFSDRPHTSSPVIGAFLRTYNDGLDDERRQDLYPLASLIVGTAASRRVEAERASRCLSFARRAGGAVPGGRAGMGMATPEAAGTCAAVAALRAGPGAHADALEFVRELAALGRRRRLPEWLVGREPSHSQTAHAWRNADRANSNALSCEASAWSRTYSPSSPIQRAAGGDSIADGKSSGTGCA